MHDRFQQLIVCLDLALRVAAHEKCSGHLAPPGCIGRYAGRLFNFNVLGSNGKNGIACARNFTTVRTAAYKVGHAQKLRDKLTLRHFV